MDACKNKSSILKPTDHVRFILTNLKQQAKRHSGLKNNHSINEIQSGKSERATIDVFESNIKITQNQIINDQQSF